MSEDATMGAVKIIGGPEPQYPSLARRTYDRISERIREFISQDDHLDFLREVARKLEVLPLSSANGSRWYGVKPEGDLISFSPHAPYEPLTETDEWKRAALLMRASALYPELEALVPPPPLSSQPCPRCKGSGVIQFEDDEVICICQGLGWIAPLEDKLERSDRSHEIA
jgi:hypothetical protein